MGRDTRAIALSHVRSQRRASEVGRPQAEFGLVQQPLRLVSTRLSHVPPRHRTDYTPTERFELLELRFVFVVLAHDGRRIVSINVTSRPSASWAANQIVQAFPWETAPRHLLRDRAGIHGACLRGRVQNLGVEEILIAPRSPWQSPFVERVLGTLRLELLDHFIVLHEQHLRRLLRTVVAAYYHPSRTHLSLGKDSPDPRRVEPPDVGQVIELPVVGGLHHRYARRAA